jgi:hypothetical protein
VSSPRRKQIPDARSLHFEGTATARRPMSRFSSNPPTPERDVSNSQWLRRKDRLTRY